MPSLRLNEEGFRRFFHRREEVEDRRSRGKMLGEPCFETVSQENVQKFKKENSKFLVT